MLIVKKLRAFRSAGREPMGSFSGSVYVWKTIVSLSTNLGQHVRKYGALTGLSGNGVGAEPAGSRVSSFRSPVTRSRTAIWTACWPSSAGPITVKVMRRPFGLKETGGEKVYAPNKSIVGLPKAGPSRKLGSPLGGPRRRPPVPSDRTRKIPLLSCDSGPNGKNGAASFTS